MSEIDTVSMINQMRIMAAQAKGQAPEASTSTEFGSVFQRALGEVSQMQGHADTLKAKFEMGASDVSVGEVMIAAQKANLAFEATVRVRNELVKAYKEVMDSAI